MSPSPAVNHVFIWKNHDRPMSRAAEAPGAGATTPASQSLVWLLLISELWSGC